MRLFLTLLLTTLTCSAAPPQWTWMTGPGAAASYGYYTTNPPSVAWGFGTTPASYGTAIISTNVVVGAGWTNALLVAGTGGYFDANTHSVTNVQFSNWVSHSVFYLVPIPGARTNYVDLTTTNILLALTNLQSGTNTLTFQADIALDTFSVCAVILTNAQQTSEFLPPACVDLTSSVSGVTNSAASSSIALMLDFEANFNNGSGVLTTGAGQTVVASANGSPGTATHMSSSAAASSPTKMAWLDTANQNWADIEVGVLGSQIVYVQTNWPATNYFVDTGLGSDSNSGLSGSPWLTSSNAAAHLTHPNITVTFTGGQMFNNAMNITGTGQAGQPLTISSSGSTKAILSVTNGVSALSFTNAGYVNVCNLQIIGTATNLTVGGMANGQFGIVDNLGDGQTHSSFLVTNCDISRFGSGIFFGSYAVNSMLINSSCSNNFVHDCAETGIGWYNEQYGSSDHSIRFTNMIADFNIISNIFGFSADTYGSGLGIEDGNCCAADISYNTILICGHSAGGNGGGMGIDHEYNPVGHGANIVGNEIWNTGPGPDDSGGIDLDWYSDSCYVFGNYVHDNLGSGLYFINSGSNNVICFNVFINNGTNSGAATYGEVSDYQWGSYISAGSHPGSAKIFNNTFISLSAKTPNTFTLVNQFNGTNILANNILVASNADSISIVVTNGWTLAGNNYWNRGVSGTPNFYWSSSTYYNFADFTNGTGQDIVGHAVTPYFTNTTWAVNENFNAATIASSVTNYNVISGTTLYHAALNLNALYGFTMPTVDFNDNTLPGSGYSVGACNP